jgi:hypothetical protein
MGSAEQWVAVERCHCGGWFDPDYYGECRRCRGAYVAALNTVRRVFPGARIVGVPGFPYESSVRGDD